MNVRRILPVCLVSMSVFLSVCTGFVRAEESLWTSDFDAAKTKAKTEKKFLLVDFTGSDWCVWCKKLKAEVFDKEAFQTEAPKQFVLVELDYPRQTKISDELKEQNAKLAKEYKVRGFPTVLMLDAEGQVIAHTGYRADGPEKYMAHLGEFSKIYDGVLKTKSELEKAKGLDRAKLLDQLVAAYDKLSNPTDDLKDWSKEIVELDADNKAGLKNKYECRLAIMEAEQLGADKKYAEAIETLDKALEISGITGEQKQNIYFIQGQYQNVQKDLAATLACLKKALEAAPESEKAERIKGLIKSIAPSVEAQEFIAKNLDSVEKAEGLDRAQLLDQIIEANSKLMMVGGSKIPLTEIAKWRKEIVELDADNKAGLKNKYAFATIVQNASMLARSKKFDEAQSTLDKAIALSGISAAQTQEGLTVKGNFYMMEKEFSKAIESLTGALQADPEGRYAPTIKMLMQRAEQEAKKSAETAKKEAVKAEDK